MSDPMKQSAGPNGLQTPVPSWIGAGIIGLMVGAGSTLIVMRSYAPSSTSREGIATTRPSSEGPGPGPMSGGPPAMTGMGAGMPGMGGGMMGMGGGMMGGGVRGKRNLTSLVGKLDLLTRETLHLELTPEQSAKIADHLVSLEKPEEMTEEEAQKQFETLQALLSPEQRAIADSISLPFTRPTGAMTGGPAGPSQENPLRQETNQKRLHDLLARIQPGSFKAPDSGPAKADENSSDPATKSTDLDTPKNEKQKTNETESDKAKPD
jgi:hypothetical protein